MSHRARSLASRTPNEIVFSWGDSATESDKHDLSHGAWGTILVEAGSDLIGKQLHIVAHSESGLYSDTELLTSPITLVAGSNPLSSDQIARVGAVSVAKLKLNSAVTDERCVILWKS